MKKLTIFFPFLMMLQFSLHAQNPRDIKKDAVKSVDTVKLITPVIPTLPVQKKAVIVQPPPRLYGFVDMHTHPVVQFAFGEQVVYGGNDGDPNVALGSCNCIHNFVVPPFSGSCGQQNMYRNKMVDEMDNTFIHAAHNKTNGFPAFTEWPKYNSLTHQQMWIDWIKRAKEGGLRVMVALAVNSHCMADAAETAGPNDDMGSMNKQINEMKALFSRHADFVEIAYSSADLRRIVNAGKLAVVLGIEVDNIGNFYSPADPKGASYNPNPTDQQIKAEIDRLYNMGVRYIFPIHLTNNIFGGTAIYVNEFNIANKYNTGSAFTVEWVNSAATGIQFQVKSPFTQIRQNILAGFAMAITGPVLPQNIMPDVQSNYPMYPSMPATVGSRNSLGLTNRGNMAIRYMMQKGMLIDIDHMSETAADATLDIAINNNYPVNSGHNGFRGITGVSRSINENGRTNAQVQKIYNLGGMMGIGHGGHSTNFVNCYRYGLTLSGGQSFAIGTDANGFFPLPAPPMQMPSGPFNPLETITYGPSLTKCVTGAKAWDFNAEGMAHYGLLPDFIESCRKVGMTKTEQDAFFSSAERFAQMWEKCDASSKNVR
jgi:microsomal dipeptidase-like Zn-dependent dipeptidase